MKKILLLIILMNVSMLSKASNDNLFIFTYFVNNGASGVYLAISEDGIHFTTVNKNKPMLTPPDWPSQNLTRDPSIIYRDGMFRMVWTSHWNGDVFGYSESKDLVNWSKPVKVSPFPDGIAKEDRPINLWAPEIHWDKFKKEYFVIFSCTTPRERDNKNGSDNSGKNLTSYDNRMYITFTKDGKSFSDGKLFFDQGFSTIDGVMRWDKKNNRWAMVIKNSRNADLTDRPGRNLCLTFTGKDLDNPHFTPVTPPIAGTHSCIYSNPGLKESMAEGQCLLHYNNLWWLYWDEPAGDGMQLATSKDLKTWTHIKNVSFPVHKINQRNFKSQHGTIIVVPRKALKALLK